MLLTQQPFVKNLARGQAEMQQIGSFLKQCWTKKRLSFA